MVDEGDGDRSKTEEVILTEMQKKTVKKISQCVLSWSKRELSDGELIDRLIAILTDYITEVPHGTAPSPRRKT